MEVRTRHLDNIVILEPNGDVTIGGGAEVLRSSVLEVVEANGANVLIDLSGVSFMDSSGVGALISAYTKLSNRGRTVKLLHLSPRVHDMLQIAHLLTIFEVYDDENEAVASFG